MERVVSVNLNGNAYQLEEPAHDALRDYLRAAETALSDNPDKAEIVRDLEQAMADKCAGRLSPSKSVINAADMAKIIEEMGPVEGGASAGANAPRHESSGAQEGPRKRLYRIRDGAMIAGICSGLAAYLNVDVSVVRILTLIGGFITGGWLLLVYVVAMFLIPSAHTSEEWAAAHGVPFNAQEVIDRAKREYSRVADDVAHDWRSRWRAQRRSWREEARAQRHAWRAATTTTAPPAGYFTRLFAGMLAFVLSLTGAALLIAFVVALFALLSADGMLGWALPADIPLWLAVVVLCIAYAAIAAPIAHLRRTSYVTAAGGVHGGADGLITFAAIVAGGALAYQFLPEFRDWLHGFVVSVRALDF
jgi:phage shock protein PspC (stress-responsive transcriptional regulator)